MMNNQRRSFARRGVIRSKSVDWITTESATATRSPSQPRTKKEAMHPKDPQVSQGKSIRKKTFMNIRGLIPRVGSRRSVCKTAEEDSAKTHSPCLLVQSESIDENEDQNANPDDEDPSCSKIMTMNREKNKSDDLTERSRGQGPVDLDESVESVDKIDIGEEERDFLRDGPPQSDFVPPEFIFVDSSATWEFEI
jgi:hypothetical protein